MYKQNPRVTLIGRRGELAVDTEYCLQGESCLETQVGWLEMEEGWVQREEGQVL
jgi:hypothetical protein